MSEQIMSALTAAGAPFEYAQANVNGQPLKVFKNALPYLSSFYGNLQQFGETELAVYGERRISYAQTYKAAASLAQMLATDYGITKGARVGLVMRNSPEWLVSFIAITSLGAIAALVNSRGAADEIDYAVSHTKCDLIIIDHKIHRLLGDADTLLATPHIVFDVDKHLHATDAKGKQHSLDGDHQLPETACDADDTALILFTSGTTGRPKGAMLSHRGIMNALKANEFSGAIIGSTIAAQMGVDLATLAANAPQSSTLLMFPLFHVSGCYSVFLSSLLRGGKLVMLSRWVPDEALSIMEKERVTTFYGVPTMYWDVLNLQGDKQYDLSSLQSLSVAGQSTPESLLKQISTAFPNTMIGCGYGMTETNGVICMTIGPEYLADPNSVGRPLSIAELKIETGDGEIASTGESGEICIRGATVMQGYDQRPEANAECFKDGWFHTGDVGYIDENGKLYVVDRMTEMVIVGGENVYCAEVERVLSQMAGVVETVTFGVPDDRLGERMVALIRYRDGEQQTEDEVRSHLKTVLASYKIPTEIHIIEQPLILNATGKILKAEAKKLWKQIT